MPVKPAILIMSCGSCGNANRLTPLAVIGYSLGGNVLLKWLGEQGAQAPVIGAVAVSVPFTLANAAVRLNSGVSRLYQWSLLRRLRASMREKWHGQGRIDDVAMLDSLAQSARVRRSRDGALTRLCRRG